MVGAGIFSYYAFIAPDTTSPASNTPTETVTASATTTPSTTATPKFEWRFAQASSLNPDGNPKTDVYLAATYDNEVTHSKLIATTDGGCAALPDAEKDSVTGAETIQCYYAGHGYRFKVTKAATAYQIQQKEFEEGSPEYTPPNLPYKVIAELPLSI